MYVIKLSGSINTNNYGINKLLNFYNTAKKYSYTHISIDFYDLKWIDANLCAVFQGIIFKLNKERGLNFSTDEIFLKQKFDILIRNGFYLFDENASDARSSTVTLRKFYKNESHNFLDYLDNDLLSHRSLKENEDLKENILGNLLEVFENYEIHSKTEYPVFVCGQYYPTKKILKFTLADIGVGFLEPISIKKKEIKTSIEAIRWAIMNGNSTKDLIHKNTPGGLGLFDLHQFMIKNKGKLEIVTGNVYWTSKHKEMNFNTYKTLNNNLLGTTINLVFNCY
ncbi:hypothetical protein IZU89_16740 [Cellulophaga lytica]|uniref:hypothetical protein n=1 Tax=Cellulophaga lytica TaxID=979 RepID=UPI0032E49528